MQNDNSIHAFDDEIDLFELAQKILKKWKIIFGITLTVTIIATIIAYTLPQQYVAKVTYEPYGTYNKIGTKFKEIIPANIIAESISNLLKLKKKHMILM